MVLSTRGKVYFIPTRNCCGQRGITVVGAYLAYVGNQRTYTQKNSNTPISAMNLQRFLALALAPFVIVASSTFATTISECQADIANLRTETQAATITGKNAAKDQAGLIGKLDGAAVELDKGKFCDSIKKLNDFKTKVNQLIAGGSIDA